jgi:hypothetical protein
MEEKPAQDRAAQVAACTAAAAHRRDHHHLPGASPECHPHAVEVVHLGRRAVTVCHDCAADSGFLPEKEAEALACEHRDRTQGRHSAPFPAAVA